MAKKVQRKNKTPIVIMDNGVHKNYFDDGGDTLPVKKSLFDSSGVNQAISGGTDLVSGLFDTYNSTSKIKDTKGLHDLFKPNSFAFDNIDSYDEALAGWSNMQRFNDVKSKDLRGEGTTGSIVGGTAKAAGAGAAIGSIVPGIGTAIGAGVGALGGLVSGLFGSSKAKKKANKEAKLLNQERNAFMQLQEDGLLNVMGNIGTQNNMKNMANYFAKGGTMNDFNNGVSFFDNGGSHEDNPLGGIHVSTDPQGNPNMVEEGEVAYKDFVYSDRVFADEETLLMFNLPKKYKDHSFAMIAEKESKESSERPNDEISKRGLDALFNKIRDAQEYTNLMDELKKNNMTLEEYAQIMSMNQQEPQPMENPMEQSFELPMEDPMGGTPNLFAKGGFFNETNLRYMPVIGGAISVGTDLFGKTNRPDYSEIDKLSSVPRTASHVSPEPIGNYMSYNPMDRDYYINKLGASTAGVRRSVLDNSGGNRALAMAGLLATDYNYNTGLGDLAVKSNEYNRGQYERTMGFNRDIDQFNAQQAMQANLFNSQMDQTYDLMRNQNLITQIQLRQAEKDRAYQARSMNLTNLFDSIGDIGRERMAFNMINQNESLYYGIDRNGNIYYKSAINNASDEERAEAERLTGVKITPQNTRVGTLGFKTAKQERKLIAKGNKSKDKQAKMKQNKNLFYTTRGMGGLNQFYK